MAPEREDNPLEQLIELLVYAPIGLLYEYPDVLPRLIKRGKSQVQLAKFAGQLALKQQSRQGGNPDGDSGGPPVSPELLVEGLARLLTEVGSMVGLAPSHSAPARTGARPPDDDRAGGGDPIADKDRVNGAGADKAERGEVGGQTNPARTTKLPIANYDSLTAKEVVFLLEDLTVSQLQRVRQHELDNRNRKTVLTKVDRLLS